MLDAYRRVLGRPGALLFSATGLVGRMPLSMMTLAIVLLVTAAQGRSYTLAGQVSAAYVVANAAVAVPQGRLLDRLGQRPVLLVNALVFALGCGLLGHAVRAGWAAPGPHLAAVVAGVALPQVGTAVRARWTHLLEAGPQRQTAFAVEAVVDEAVFVVGPTIVTLLATLLSPGAGLATAAVLGVVGTVALAAQRRTEPPPHPLASEPTERPRLRWAPLLVLAVSTAALGSFFGAAEVATVGFAEDQGHQALSGLLLAVWAAGSLASGVVTGAVTWRVPTVRRLRVGLLVLTVSVAPAFVVPGLLPMAGLLLVAGVAISPCTIAVFTLAEEIAPAARLGEALGLLQTGLAAGIAPGAALAGIVVDAHGGAAAYLVAVASAALAALVAALPILRA